MRRWASATAVGAAVAALALTFGAAAGEDPRRSGFMDMSAESQALQKDDAANPAMLWRAEGEEIWNRKAGSAERACADCHGAPSAMRGVAARYPVFDSRTDKPIDLTSQVNRCRQERQKAEPMAREGREMNALLTLVGLQSRGLPIRPDPNPRLAPHRRKGEAIYRQRLGQLNLSCANCHDDNAGRRLGGAPIPQGHPTGYPLYRLEWQEVGSFSRRLRNCMIGVRADPFPSGSDEAVALELYLMQRAAGMPMETPAVRP